MRLISNAFSDGDAIPKRFTCDGEDVSPSLHWNGAPPETRSFALLCDDPDAPAGTWRHWAVYDLPAVSDGLPEDAGRRGGALHLHQGVNDFGYAAYGGPCPPHRHGPHHYRFRLMALSTEKLALGGNASCRDVEREARKHALAETVLTGVYQR